MTKEEPNKMYWSGRALSHWLRNIIKQMGDAQWAPDYIVGVARGGLVPAVMLSHHFEVPLSVIYVSFRDRPIVGTVTPTINSEQRRRILVVDDINDSGATLQYIDDNLVDVGLANCEVKYAVLLDKVSSDFEVDYCGEAVLNNNEWHVFPWEEVFMPVPLN